MTANRKVSIIILASGFSTRFGGDKLISMLDHRTIIDHTISNASDSGNYELIVVVDPANTDLVKLIPKGVKVAENWNRSEGISSAVKAGLRHVDVGSDGALFLVGDQPFVSPDLIKRIISRFSSEGCKIVACRLKGVWMNPMLFDRMYFRQLMSISGDSGARQVALMNPDSVCAVDIDDPNVLFDIDTLNDLEKARSFLS